MEETYVLLGLVSSKVESADLKKNILSVVSSTRSAKTDGSRHLLDATCLCISALNHLHPLTPEKVIFCLLEWFFFYFHTFSGKYIV